MIFLLLALFLRFSVAVWVCLGIPVSFMGALMLYLDFINLFLFMLRIFGSSR